MSLKIAFAGTPEIAAQHLEALIKADFNIVAVFTQPDRPSGRGNKLQASAVKSMALKHNLEVLQPQTLKDAQIQQKIQAMNLDFLIVVAYGLLLPTPVLQAPKFGCINMHASLLPKWRGAAPIQRSILAGDSKTGMSIMLMDAGLDTGGVFLQTQCDITDCETTSSLTQKLSDLGCKTLIENLANIANLKPIAQDENLATYAHKIQKSEAQINFSEDAIILDRKIRTFEPAWFVQSSDEVRVRIWQAKAINKEHSLNIENSANLENPNNPSQTKATGIILAISAIGVLISCGNNSQLLIEKIQFAGGKPLFIKDLLNGKKLNWQIGKSIYE